MNKQFDEDLHSDALALKVVRFIFICQEVALLAGLIFVFARLTTLAFFLSFMALVLLLGALLWAYIRYQTFPIVQEKKELSKKSLELQGKIAKYQRSVLDMQQKQVELQRDGQAEIQAALKAHQTRYIQNGMIAAKIADADIDGIGEKMKQRLAASGYTNAANINQQVTAVEGLGPVKTQAVLHWHNQVYGGLDRSKPISLPLEQVELIKQKYKDLYISNREKEHEYQLHKASLEGNFGEIQPRIQALAPVRFGSYLKKALTIQRVPAWVVAAGIIITLVCLWTSTTVGAIVAAIPTLTKIPTATITLTFTDIQTITDIPTIMETLTIIDTPTSTDTPTITLTPTNTETPTFTLTPSRTYTPTMTATRTPTKTLTRTITRTPLPYVPPVDTKIPGGINGNPWGYNFEGGQVIYDPPSNFCSYFTCISSFWNGSGYVIECADGKFSKSGGRSGACSQHGGYSRTLYSP